jgi:hypothetical protein
VNSSNYFSRSTVRKAHWTWLAFGGPMWIALARIIWALAVLIAKGTIAAAIITRTVVQGFVARRRSA